MKGQVICYSRVSTADQNEALRFEDVACDRSFTDRCSAKDTNRPELQKLLGHVREGDIVVCHSLDRMAGSLVDLCSLVNLLTHKGARVEFRKEGLTFTRDDSPKSKLLFSVVETFAEFERSLIRERQRDGIAAAKASGVYKGRKPALTAKQAGELRKRVDAGMPLAKAARELKVSRQAAYTALGRRKRLSKSLQEPASPSAAT